MAHYRLNYLNRIREMGYRLTPQRQIILDAICEQGGHASAREVYERVQRKTPSINRATVYRVLDFFCELNLATKTELNGRTLYEIVGEEPHHHIVCNECGQAAVVPEKYFDELTAHVWQEYAFKAELKHMVIPGICRHCPPPNP